MKQRVLAAVFVAFTTVVADAQSPAGGAKAPALQQSGAEAATARRFAAIRGEPLPLLAFLHEMPKGGDLHNHLSGAVYAESFLRWSAGDKLCLTTTVIAIAACAAPPAADQVPIADVLQNQQRYSALYNEAIDALSMRNWNAALNGHDHFFQTFGKFGPASGKTGDMLAEVTARAAAEQVSYLELMLTPAGTASFQFAGNLKWPTDPNPNFAPVRQQLLDAGFAAAVRDEAKRRLDAADARQRDLLRCGTAQQDAGCTVTVRYVAQVSRGSTPAQVFTLMVAGFELAGIDPRIVSLNLVQPEDDPTAIRDFRLQMAMLGFLHQQYPAVPITMHAGELAEGLVPPEAMRFHIAETVKAGAKRIGHGVDIFYEDDPIALLKDMAAKKVLVEIALSSNDQILGVKGNRHPLRQYLRHGVPVAIVTDDMGVARSNHTKEFLKAVEEQDLDYPTLKRLVRNSIEFSFADAATKARLKSNLEAAFIAFERRQAAPAIPGSEKRR